jgi:hypothetical protein
MVWPVGPGAERLTGAAALLGEGSFRVRGWGSRFDGEHVLLVGLHLLGLWPLEAAADHARALGAETVSACAVKVDGPTTGLSEGLDAFFPLATVTQQRRRSA